MTFAKENIIKMDIKEILELGEFINKSLFDGSAKTNSAFDEGVILFTQHAVTILKKQEPKEVVHKSMRIKFLNEYFEGECPSCGCMIDELSNSKCCGNCGQAVKWDA